ncbi:MAG: hypothetical protein U0X93_12580 [Anaerolineales bacterium]
MLTGKYTRGEPPPEGSRGTFSPYVKNRLTDANFDKLDALRSFADSYGHTLHDLAFSWLLSVKQVPLCHRGRLPNRSARTQRRSNGNYPMKIWLS